MPLPVPEENSTTVLVDVACAGGKVSVGASLTRSDVEVSVRATGSRSIPPLAVPPSSCTGT